MNNHVCPICDDTGVNPEEDLTCPCQVKPRGMTQERIRVLRRVVANNRDDSDFRLLAESLDEIERLRAADREARDAEWDAAIEAAAGTVDAMIAQYPNPYSEAIRALKRSNRQPQPIKPPLLSEEEEAELAREGGHE